MIGVSNLGERVSIAMCCMHFWWIGSFFEICFDVDAIKKNFLHVVFVKNGLKKTLFWSFWRGGGGQKVEKKVKKFHDRISKK
jgi:hypothetical protein